MPIKQGDLQLLASRVMDDVPEGGAGPSAIVIEDGKSNAIMPDISESDRARGRVNMRQMHLAVRTDDTDVYMGANIIVAEPPSDSNVSITLFSTDGVYDTRAQAQARLEAYLNKGAEWSAFLYENHIKGQRQIQMFQRPGAELPLPGKTLVLVQNEGLPNELVQYVRAIRVSSVERMFTFDTDKDYKAVIVTMELSDPLRSDFTGTSANRQFSRAANSAKLRDTVVADAASYVGCTPLKQAVGLGSFTAVAKSIYAQLVPSSQSETPIASAVPFASANFPVLGVEPVSFVTDQNWTTAINMYLPGGCAPGSLKITLPGGSVLTDAGGLLMSGTQQVGTVDYANGIVVSTSGSYNGSKSITFRPAAYIQRAPQSMEIQVTAESRSLSYVGFIVPIATRGSLSISYMVQKRWYTLSDAGDGALRGSDANYGAGTYSSETGGFVLTLGALPDVGSSLIFTFSVPTQETVHPAADLLISQTIDLQLPAGQALYPGAFDIKWMDGTQQRTATAATDWKLQGDAVGEVRVGRSQLLFSPKLLPAVGTVLDITVDTAPANEINLVHPSRNGQGRLAVSAGVGGWVPFSVEVEWNTLTDTSVLGSYTLEQVRAMGISQVDPTQVARDDGLGKLMLNGLQVGTVNYAAGSVDFVPDVTIKIPKPHYSAHVASGSAFFGTAQYRLNYEGIEYRDAPSTYPNDESGYVKLRFRTTGSATRKTLQVTFAPEFDLIPGVQAPIVPGSLLLMPSSGQPWSDSAGVVRTLTAAGFVTRGNVAYPTGRLQLTSWTAGSSNALRRASCTTTLGEALTSAFVGRTAAAPIRPGSFSAVIPKASGGVQTITAATDGSIMAPGVIGSIDVETGLYRLAFGSFVTAAGNESQPWYQVANVGQDGKIFKPAPVVMSGVRYSAVAYSYLPLDANLTGIETVRLPSDGRVPMFRNGGMCVVGHQASTAQMNVSNSQTIDLGRVRLSRVAVRDSSGKHYQTGYTADLEAGRITFTDTSAMTMPVVVEHRIEDYVMATDVQISGEITFNRQLTHDYPLGSYISGALEGGDRHARVSQVFDQNTWDSATWSDAPVGNVAVASYDQGISPIEVTNAGCTTERWIVHFTSNTQFRVIGEHVGVIATGDINTVCAPINPATKKPYFSIPVLGWGSGWVPGNIVRINTVGAIYSFWAVRTIQAGPESGIEHSFAVLARGGVDRP